MFDWAQSADGIVTLTMDDPAHAVNTMNETFIRGLIATLDRLEAERETVQGVILTSAKQSFFAGGDLRSMLAERDPVHLTWATDIMKAQLRRLEKLGRPVVAAVNGAALGGGLEIALACHHRVVLDRGDVRLGLPEITLGIIPGAGGVTRTVRMLGLSDALTKVLLEGRAFRPAQALEIGLVDELATGPDELLAKARAWIAANPDAAQPWDVKGYRNPGGDPKSLAFANNVIIPITATLRGRSRNTPFLAPQQLLSTAVEGTQVDVDTALKIETRYFADLVCGQIAKNMMQAFHFDMQHITKGRARPAGFPRRPVTRVVVLGAGMMGAGIAYRCAKAGIEVVLKDVTLDAAQRGKEYSRKVMTRAKVSPDKQEELLARITPTDRAADALGADLMIEAVFEDTDLKKQVFADIEPHLAPDALLGSNTSTLPISGLADGVTRPEDFIGLHFFSPVDKMQLLEIIVGEKTSDAALARAVDFAAQIGKTPIVVGDSRGFFTSRVIGTFINEAVRMVAEGVAAASIEQAGLQAGYPTAPLALSDEINMKLGQKVRNEYRRAHEAAGGTWVELPHFTVGDRMVDEFGRPGRLEGAGFYDYADGRRTGLWPGLKDAFGGGTTHLPFADMVERMLFAEAIESVKCLDEGVLRSVPEANIGSIVGIGFPAWTGGVLQYVNQYDGGLSGFVARARELAERYGERFEPPASLVERAARGEVYA
ncbi:3-hydroxyacyl-CoA dehydrogenase NAD-binding domain-containing protein [Catellatospora sp. NPDC049609]|uniref:3-hydroxyacyl-CoA dehydrogenase NAD-binding domain-containing protein n=1 Tax=Catellatospora sp. NPDC049609 TaxID=3155505 RepID=UPI003430C1D3